MIDFTGQRFGAFCWEHMLKNDVLVIENRKRLPAIFFLIDKVIQGTYTMENFYSVLNLDECDINKRYDGRQVTALSYVAAMFAPSVEDPNSYGIRCEIMDALLDNGASLNCVVYDAIGTILEATINWKVAGNNDDRLLNFILKRKDARDILNYAEPYHVLEVILAQVKYFKNEYDVQKSLGESHAENAETMRKAIEIIAGCFKRFIDAGMDMNVQIRDYSTDRSMTIFPPNDAVPRRTFAELIGSVGLKLDNGNIISVEQWSSKKIMSTAAIAAGGATFIGLATATMLANVGERAVEFGLIGGVLNFMQRNASESFYLAAKPVLEHLGIQFVVVTISAAAIGEVAALLVGMAIGDRTL